MERNKTWFHRWIYYSASDFMFAAALLRSVMVFSKFPTAWHCNDFVSNLAAVFKVNLLLAGGSRWIPALLIGLGLSSFRLCS
jgi:hypothetical protein